MYLKYGVVSNEAKAWQILVGQLGYNVGPRDGKFFTQTDLATRQFQGDHGLTVDGIVGVGGDGGETFTTAMVALSRLEQRVSDDVVDSFIEVIKLPSGLPTNEFDQRVSDMINLGQNCDEGQGLRYGGWIDPYQFDKAKFDAEQTFWVPKIGRVVESAKESFKVLPGHGGTCSPWLGHHLGAILCANEDYNFRIGRSGRDIATADHDHYVGRTIVPGYGDYCEVHGSLRLEHRPLDILYQHWEWMNKVNIVEMDHHVICILKVGGEDGFWLEDPHDAGEPLAPGLYRWAADGYYPRVGGKKFYSGTKQTFRRISDIEGCKQRWDFYRVTDMDPDDCCPKIGPWKGRKPWPVKLEV